MIENQQNFYGRPQPEVPKKVPSPPLVEAEGDNTLTETLRERREPRLSDFNPLLYPLELTNRDAIETFKAVTRAKIREYQGIEPTFLDSYIVFNPTGGNFLRFIARFEIGKLTEEQVKELESLAKKTYDDTIKTRTGRNNNRIAAIPYPVLEQSKRGAVTKTKSSRMLGWYMGYSQSDITNSDLGMLVFKDFGEAGIGDYYRRKNPAQWFFKDDLVNPEGKALKSGYVVEIREDEMFQTDLVEFIVQVSSILANKGHQDTGPLIYAIYNDLNRLNLRRASRDSIHGLNEQIERIRRVLILPLANLDLSSGINLPPESVLLTGVPGTGKTLIAQHLLQEDTGIFLLPLDPAALATDIGSGPERRKIIPRIAQVFNKTNIPVVILIDDIENITSNESQINSTLLNLMAGVRENGFFVIASTNYPENLSPQLLQPQRFAHVIYFGLHDEEARKAILDIHATRISKELGKQLFESEEQREAILQEIASHTDSFTPRFLAEVCTEAKSFYLKRIADNKTHKGLTEADIDETLAIDDWVRALEEVTRKYDKDATKKRDKELKGFVEKFYRQSTGFISSANGRLPNGQLKKSIEERIAAKQKPQT